MRMPEGLVSLRITLEEQSADHPIQLKAHLGLSCFCILESDPKLQVRQNVGLNVTLDTYRHALCHMP